MSNKVPQLRFNGYSDDWEERKLGTIYDFGRGKGLPLASFIYSSDNPAIAYGHLYTKYPEVISEVFWSSNDNGVLSKDNDLLFPGSSTVPNGTAQANAITLNNVKLGGDIIIGRPKKGASVLSTFMSYQVNSQRHKLFPITVGTTITHMYGKDISKLNFFVTDYSEQEKIASFFTQLNTGIDLHQRKLDLLKEQKKGYLQKMFPKNGAKVPELRFAGFADAWEERKLGDLGSVAMNKRIFKEQTSDVGDIPFYKIGTFGGTPDAFISRDIFEEYKSKYQYPEVGDILISASGSIGRTVVYRGDDEYFQDSNIVWLKHDQQLDNSFLKQFYSIVKWQGLEGSTIKRLYNKNILETKITLPSPEEQAQLGSFFKQLDNTIALHQRKLDLLKEQKKGFLQKMFV
ncbi:restriction endonuclease subunit S [Lactiplantibacillus plantarum]|uniref:restriction endonuclease subunit S n=1 Tax=Lactiplantibacillus plantarum TaxID=1590 RepID=UPI003F539D0C